MLASQFHQWLQIKSDNNALKFQQENCYDLILIRIRSLANARLVSSKKEYSHAAQKLNFIHTVPLHYS